MVVHVITELAKVFLRLGLTGFGGPAAHIALMREQVVTRRGWVTEQDFLDMLAATNLIPGPNSTELAIHIGLRHGGWLGFVVAGVCFVLPAACIVGALAALYTAYGLLPELEWILWAVKPVVLLIVGQALLGLGRVALKSRQLVLLAGAAAIANLLGVHELAVLLGAGAVYGVRRWMLVPLPAAVAVAPTALGLFLSFLKIGSVLFGSGYVLLAFLRGEFVERLAWITEGQLFDAIAVGQATPGPLFTAATFIGYLVAGWPGAVTATVGMFLPAFVFVALSGRLIPHLRKSATAGRVLDAVNAASLALMAVVTFELGVAVITNAGAAAIGGVAGFLLWRYRVSSSWLLLGAALLGYLLRLAS
jgi:chromate transporter